MGNFIVSLTRGKNFGLSYQEVGITEGLRNQGSTDVIDWGFAHQPCCMAGTMKIICIRKKILFPMGKNFLSYANYFHCFCHVTWLLCKTPRELCFVYILQNTKCKLGTYFMFHNDYVVQSKFLVKITLLAYLNNCCCIQVSEKTHSFFLLSFLVERFWMCTKCHLLQIVIYVKFSEANGVPDSFIIL